MVSPKGSVGGELGAGGGESQGLVGTKGTGLAVRAAWAASSSAPPPLALG